MCPVKSRCPGLQGSDIELPNKYLTAIEQLKKQKPPKLSPGQSKHPQCHTPKKLKVGRLASTFVAVASAMTFDTYTLLIRRGPVPPLPDLPLLTVLRKIPKICRISCGHLQATPTLCSFWAPVRSYSAMEGEPSRNVASADIYDTNEFRIYEYKVRMS